MKLIIAEKPDQGSTLASVFKNKKHQGFIEIFPNEIFKQGAYVTWAVGHLCQLVPPEKYQPEWKKWSLDTLPMIPSHFEYEVSKDKAKQFSIVKKLVNDPKVSEIIHAGDAGREGELIVRNILRLSKSRKPMKRLWISSLTANAIRSGFEKLLDENETRSLYFEAYTRACADWVVGMNASRLYSLLLQKQGFSDIFSVGRVQTPTLALIVKREREIESFVSRPFWEVAAHFLINGKKFTGKWEKDGETRIDTKELAEKIVAFCREKDARVQEVVSERKEFPPPLLYNLSALQAEANKRYKFSPKKTLDLLQKLYQKGNVSYPRSDSRYVTEEEAGAFPGILDKLSKIKGYESHFPLPFGALLNNKRYVNEKKVTDHYAIIPTEQIPNMDKMEADERRLYDLVVTSLIAAHYDKAISEYTTVKTIVDGRASFISKGKVQIQEGWRKVLAYKDKEEEPVLPILLEGEEGITKKVEVKESQTQPPKRYTEGQLITLMKTAGKHIEDKELERILAKTEGLGTEATRAGIITMLKDRHYIEVNKNIVSAAAKGKILIDAIGEQVLSSPEMTAKWEQKLKQISDGSASAKQFMEQTNKMIHHIVSEGQVLSGNWAFSEDDRNGFTPGKKKQFGAPAKLGPCKKCDGQLVDKGSFYGCTNYKAKKCNFTISKKIMGKTITQKNVKKLLTVGKTDVIEGFKSNERIFNAALIWDQKEQKIKLNFGAVPIR
jgi:DNA topoisomerase III